MKNSVLTNEEIIQELMKILGHPTKASLTRDLEISKQSLFQFCQQPGLDINNKIASLLIEHIHSRQD